MGYTKLPTDMNVVMDESGNFIEIQGTAERQPFSMDDLVQLLALAKQGGAAMLAAQQAAIMSDAAQA